MISNKVSISMTRCVASLFLFLQTGCLVLDDEHCLANGGDLACPGQFCLLETGKTAGNMNDDLGCADRRGESKDHLHVKYGVPATVKMTEADRNLDSVHGILFALREDHGIEDSCRLDSPELKEEYDEVVHSHYEVYIVRARMERQGQVRTRPARISTEEIERVDAYNHAVDAWLDACLEKAALEM